MQGFLQFAPLLGGALLLLICLINILRNPQISNSNAALLAFGGLLFAVPTFANFNFSGLGVQFSAQKIGDQLNVQGADIKLALADIKQAIAAVAKEVNAAAPTAAPKASPAQVVLVFYVKARETLALSIQNYLLGAGYAANAIYTDFSELSLASRGQPGTVRLVYVSAVAPQEKTLLAKLKQQFPGTAWTDASNDSLTAANWEIQLF